MIATSYKLNCNSFSHLAQIILNAFTNSTISNLQYLPLIWTSLSSYLSNCLTVLNLFTLLNNDYMWFICIFNCFTQTIDINKLYHAPWYLCIIYCHVIPFPTVWLDSLCSSQFFLHVPLFLTKTYHICWLLVARTKMCNY